MPQLTKRAIPTSEDAPRIWKPTKKNKSKEKKKHFQQKTKPGNPNIQQNHWRHSQKSANLKQNLSGSTQQRHGLWSIHPMTLHPWEPKRYSQPLHGLVAQNCPYPMKIPSQLQIIIIIIISLT